MRSEPPEKRITGTEALEIELRASRAHGVDLYLDLEKKAEQIEALEWDLEAVKVALEEARQKARRYYEWLTRIAGYIGDRSTVVVLEAEGRALPWLKEQVTPDPGT